MSARLAKGACQLKLSDLISRHCPVAEFASGQTIFSENDVPDGHMYVVITGSVQFIKQGRLLETIESGGIFGEVAMLDGLPRTACAVAVEPTRVAAVSEDEFKSMILRQPSLALDIMRVLARRLRATLNA